ncbi:unnamed protein product [Arctia plantaginis]|uniref:Dolichol phosphate-mannose biosynthesis regulatory protein n=1 Tax=Arctia plantaginis TaxID=874455 RepID=A0A8S1A0S8_ARCPL|nr:unnamed protein product [Arctia plantaginis]CAB3240371.1 unnamed protein product [Arctia plantaginis]
MDVPDRVIAKVVLGTTSFIFILLTLWINSYPFIDEDSSFYSLVPDPKWFLLFCGTWGLFFIGGLMSFTLYHMFMYQ